MTDKVASKPFEGCGSTFNSTLPANFTPTLAATVQATPTQSRTIRMDIYSDTTCPWCYITKRRLEKAMHNFQSQFETSDPILFDIHWHPYQLDPQAPQIPVLRSKALTRKFGTEKSNQIQQRLVAAGRVEGIEFSHSDQSLYCNTMDSHRLIRFARERMGPPRKPKSLGSGSRRDNEEGSVEVDVEMGHIDEIGNVFEDAMVEELFKSHFERGECGDLQTLKECGRKVLEQISAKDGLKMDDEEVQRQLTEMEQVLQSDEGLEEVKEEIRMAKQDLQLQGVPAIVVQNTYLLSGGQDPSTFVEIFKRVI
ncbi:hypothetical protein BGX28_004265 [Mortierella sp. GBA30]|nr:hypothetical protein BGX28_004265 [Mortierella sp. GBA30]